MRHNSESAAGSSAELFKKAVSITSRRPRIPRLIYEEL
jgi:hypothetical protein